jgi:hypothetical protein
MTGVILRAIDLTGVGASLLIYAFHLMALSMLTVGKQVAPNPIRVKSLDTSLATVAPVPPARLCFIAHY